MCRACSGQTLEDVLCVVVGISHQEGRGIESLGSWMFRDVAVRLQQHGWILLHDLA